jgi:hypothetical protein
MPTRKRTAAPPPSQRAANQAFLQEQKQKALELLEASRAPNTNRVYKSKQDEFSV